MSTDRKKNFNKFVKHIVADLNKRPETKKLSKKDKEHVAREIWKELNHSVTLSHGKRGRGQLKGGKLTTEEMDDLNEEYIRQRNKNAKAQEYVNWAQLALHGYNAARILGSVIPYVASALL